ncbi:MAG: hypothetical protein QNI88_08215 [Desulfobacterales bacterium]|nr:hypothetical protein [Desulfobacterales bacterium]
MVAICDHLEKLKFSPVNPRVFTEHGAIMAASVLNSPRAIEVSVFVVRAFVQLRETLAQHKEISRKIEQIERRLSEHDEQITALVGAIKQLMSPKLPPQKRRIGFTEG